MNYKYIGIVLFFLFVGSYFYFGNENSDVQALQVKKKSSQITTNNLKEQVAKGQLITKTPSHPLINKQPENLTSDASMEKNNAELVNPINENEINITKITNTIRNMINNSGVMDKPSIVSALKTDDFSLYIEQLEQSASIEELEKQDEIRNIMSSFSEVNQYQHDVACGHQVCAISIRDFPEISLAKLSKEELSSLPLGTSFQKKLANEYGSYDLRLIYQIEQVSRVTINME